MKSEWREHGGEDLEAKILVASNAVGDLPDDASLVESFNENKRGRDLRPAARRDAITVTLDVSVNFSSGSEGPRTIPRQPSEFALLFLEPRATCQQQTTLSVASTASESHLFVSLTSAAGLQVRDTILGKI